MLLGLDAERSDRLEYAAALLIGLPLRHSALSGGSSGQIAQTRV
jgi:hypothetical protein